MTTVTPRTVSVNGPEARVSLIMAMADDGDLAMAIMPVRIALSGVEYHFQRKLERFMTMKSLSPILALIDGLLLAV